MTRRYSEKGLSRREFLQATKAGVIAMTIAPRILGESMEPKGGSKELIDASAVWLAGAIRRREVSSEEVVKAFLQRIEKVNPRINAVVQLRADAAIAEARAADQEISAKKIRGPLHGVPFTVKDSFDTAGVVSTA